MVVEENEIEVGGDFWVSVVFFFIYSCNHFSLWNITEEN
jgi:hypothetical protein